MAAKMNTSRQSSTSENVCNLCYQEADAWAVGQCDHALCLRCSARLRVLCSQNECPVCRVVSPKVAMVSKSVPFSSIKFHTFIEYHKKQYGIHFETQALLKKFQTLLSYHCTKCDKTGSSYDKKRPSITSWSSLKDHMYKEHSLFYCDICLRSLKLFPCEHKTYTRQELGRHEREGDTDDRSHKGHPLCKFCAIRYLDNEALFEHLKKDHFSCHFCDADGKQDYYPNYHHLKRHFREMHYLCEQGECYYEKFTTAFRTKIDLQAHRSRVHKRGLSKAEAKQLRHVDVGFTYARGGGGGGEEGPPTQRKHHHQYSHDRHSEVEQLEVAKALSLAEQPQDKSSQRRREDDCRATGDSTASHGESETAGKDGEMGRRNGKCPDASTTEKGAPSKKKPPPPGLAVAVDRNDITSTTEPSTGLMMSKGQTISGKNSKSNKSPQLSTKQSRPPGMDAQADHDSGKMSAEGNVYKVAQELLGHDATKLTEFRSKSGLYLCGDITVASYYSTCNKLFGSSWSDFGLQLAATIPNDTKRHELKEFLLKRSEIASKPPPGFDVPAKKLSKKGKKKAVQSSGPWQSTHPQNNSIGLSSTEFPCLSTVPVESQSKMAVSEPGWDISEVEFPCLSSGSVLSRQVVQPQQGWSVKVTVK